MKLIKEHAAVDALPHLGVLDWNDGSESATWRLLASILESGRLAGGEEVWLMVVPSGTRGSLREKEAGLNARSYFAGSNISAFTFSAWTVRGRRRVVLAPQSDVSQQVWGTLSCDRRGDGLLAAVLALSCF